MTEFGSYPSSSDKSWAEQSCGLSSFLNRRMMEGPERRPISASLDPITLRPPTSLTTNTHKFEKQAPKSSQFDKVELPSIRLAVPEFDSNRRSVQNPPTEYIVDRTSHDEPSRSPTSPNTRKRPFEEDQGFGFYEQRKHPKSPLPGFLSQGSQSTAISPILSGHATESWTSSTRSSPYSQPRNYHHRVKSPPAYETNRSYDPTRSDSRMKLPSLPVMTLDHGPTLPPHHGSEYALGSSRSGARTHPQLLTSRFEPPISSYQHPTFPSLSYGYQQPRGQSYSGPSSHPFSHDRTPFSNSHQTMYPGSNFPYGMDSGHDGKQRKRRGNLPKETTDKLRAWFVAHLQHPYPTEDEKQELMKATNLQINQISNWFINARRRQLPTMINSARAETDVRQQRENGDGNVRGENKDYGDEKPTSPSDGEGSVFDDDYDGQSRSGLPMNQKRDSI